MKIKKQAKELAKKLAPVYEFLEWEWSRSSEEGEDERYIPDAIDIYAVLMELYNDLGTKNTSCATGGLMVERYLDDEKNTIVKLSFEIAEEIYENN